MCTLSKLAEDLLENHSKNENYHEAVFDVSILQQLVVANFPVSLILKNVGRFEMKVTDYTDKSVIHSKVNNLSIFKSILSNYMIRKIALLDISFEQLKEIYTRDGENSLISFLSEKRTTKNLALLIMLI